MERWKVDAVMLDKVCFEEGTTVVLKDVTQCGRAHNVAGMTAIHSGQGTSTNTAPAFP